MDAAARRRDAAGLRGPCTAAVRGREPPAPGRVPQRQRALSRVLHRPRAGCIRRRTVARSHRRGSTPGVRLFRTRAAKRIEAECSGTASIAVLPLTNESGDASQQYFSDGISEDLITALGQFPGLKVIGRSSSFQFRDSKEDGRSIGAKLGVAHLLEGSVRKAGEMIRVSAELIDTADGTMQWSERYDRPYKDLFALQDEITHAVAGALKAKLLPGEHAAAQSERPPSGNLEAYNASCRAGFISPWHGSRLPQGDRVLHASN